MIRINPLRCLALFLFVGLVPMLGACDGADASNGVVVPSISIAEARQRLEKAVNSDEVEAYLEAGSTLYRPPPSPFEICLKFPDLPHNLWAPGSAKAHCELVYGSGLKASRISTLLAEGNADELDAMFAADLERHFVEDGFSEAIHGDFYLFDGSAQSERLASEWVAKSPGSAFALAARGNHYLQAARKARAARPTHRMPASDIARMREFTAKAVADFNAALEIEPRLIEAYNGLAHVGTIGSDGLAEQRGLAKGLELDRYCAALNLQAMWALMPRWGGSRGAMQALAEQLEAKMTERPLLSLSLAMPALNDAQMLVYGDEDKLPPDWKKRVADLLKPYALTTTNADVFETLGLACCEKGDNPREEAMYYMAASRYMKSRSCVAANRAVALVDAGYMDWGIRELRQIIDEGSDCGRAHYLLGDIYYKTGRFALAEPEFLSAMEDPVWRDSALTYLVQLAVVAKQPDKAHGYVDQYRKEFPEDTEQLRKLEGLLGK